MRKRYRDEQGFTLIELSITIVIVGATFASLVGGVLTSIAASSLQREQAQVDSVARSAAEWVKDPVVSSFVPCATTGTYSLAGLPKYGYSVAITGVQNWDPAPAPIPANFSPNFGPSGSGCSNHGLQLITLLVTSPDSRATATVQVTKRAVP